jgi:hypothetical protein
MTQGDQNAALLEKHDEEMFCGATIQELTGLVDEVMRTYETNVIYSRSGDPNVLDPSHFAGRKSGVDVLLSAAKAPTWLLIQSRV